MNDIWTTIEQITIAQIVDNYFLPILVIVTAWLVSRTKYFKDWRDKRRIYKTLKKELKERNLRFLPTSFLSSVAKIPVDRVEILCHKHKKIKRNQNKLEAWMIIP